MSTSFKASFFTQNRRALRKSIASDVPIVIGANGLLQRNGDVTFPFRQDSNFWYLTGIEEPDIVVVLSPSGDYIIVPERSSTRIIFDGAIDTTTMMDRSGIREILPEVEGWERLKNDLSHHSQVATAAALPEYVPEVGVYVNPARGRLIRQLSEIAPNLSVLDIRKDINALRVLKQPKEITAIQQAINITIDTILDVTTLKQRTIYTSEFEVEAEITRGFRYRGASGHAFAPIVASGKKTCTLHEVSNDSLISPTRLILLDIGAEVDHYAADISRTFVFGKSTQRQEDIYKAVSEIQDYALSLLKPGVFLAEYEKKVRVKLAAHLKVLGVLSSVDPTASQQYLPHAISHFLGLDVHDVGHYREPLAAGMVLTCEPGLYLPDEGIGVRIEDDVLITPKGHQVLSRRLPRSLS